MAEEIRADINLPPFDNSAMDGFAVRHADVAAIGAEPAILRVVGAVPAGGIATTAVEPGTAMRIMTGAPLPPGADLVVPFEDTDDRSPTSLRSEGRVRIFQAGEPGANVRRAGEDMRRGTSVVAARTVVTPGVIGVLASVGAARSRSTAGPKSLFWRPAMSWSRSAACRGRARFATRMAMPMPRR